MEIVICEKCAGTGKLTHDHGGHTSDERTTKCTECKGSGRMIKYVKVTLEPFKPGANESRRIF